MSESVQHDEQGSSLHAEGLTKILLSETFQYYDKWQKFLAAKDVLLVFREL
jgi:hypothetical protein